MKLKKENHSKDRFLHSYNFKRKSIKKKIIYLYHTIQNVTSWNLIEVECDPGFRGDYCNKTCPDGYYGEKCLPKCECNGSQFCHHVCGCLQRSNTTDNITTNNTEVVSSYSVETCFSSTDTSTDSTGTGRYFVFVYWWWWQKLSLLKVCSFSRITSESWFHTLLLQMNIHAVGRQNYHLTFLFWFGLLCWFAVLCVVEKLWFGVLNMLQSVMGHPCNPLTILWLIDNWILTPYRQYFRQMLLWLILSCMQGTEVCHPANAFFMFLWRSCSCSHRSSCVIAIAPILVRKCFITIIRKHLK